MTVFAFIGVMILPTKNAFLRQSTNTVMKATDPEKDKERNRKAN